jgi:hypothetical protein
MKTYPLLISFHDNIVGTGFVAHVAVNGRALLTVEEDGDCWVYGVQPGAIAGGDSDRAAALNEFKTRYQSVLYDIASEAESFEVFEEEVRNFFDQVDTVDAKAWDEALAEVRKTNPSFNEMPTVKKAEQLPVSIDVVLLDTARAQPAVNAFDEILEAA